MYFVLGRVGTMSAISIDSKIDPFSDNAELDSAM